MFHQTKRGGSPGKASSLLRKTIAGITGVIAIFSLGLASNTAFADEYDDSLDGLTDEQLAQLDQQIGIMPLTECADSGYNPDKPSAQSWVSIDFAVDGAASHVPTDDNGGMGTYKSLGGNVNAAIYCNGTRFAINNGGVDTAAGHYNGHAQMEWTMNKDMWVWVALFQWNGSQANVNFSGVQHAWQLHKGDKCLAQVWYDNQATGQDQSFTWFRCGGKTVDSREVKSDDGRGWYTMDINFETQDPRPTSPTDPPVDPEPTPDYYTLSYHANGGTGSMSSESYEEGTRAFVKRNRFNRPGYTFLGWATSPSGGVSYHPNDTIYMDSDKDLYAVWQKAPDPEPEPVEYTLSYDKNAADATGSMSSQTGEEGTSVSVKNNGFTRPGYTFQGWATSPSGGVSYNPGDPYRLTGDATLYAVWKKDPVNYTLTYDKNADDATGTTASQTGEENTSVNLRDNGFTRPNYTFQGWADTSDGPVAHNPGDSYTLTGNKTMYAVWKRNAIHLNYDANGGNGTHDPTEGEVNTNITIPGNLNDSFDRPGYEITSWNTEPDGSGTTYQPGGNVPMGTTDQTIYAQWDPIDVQLKYDPNGGEGSHDPTKGKANSDITIPSDVNDPFHRDHYELTGWNTKPDGSGDSYAPNDKVHMGITDQTLYAQWKRVPVKVIYDPNGGNGSHDPTTGDAGSDITIPSDVNDPFNKPGSILIGWNTKPDGSGDSYEPGDKLPMGDEDETLYAQWKELANVLPTTGGDGMNMPIIPIAIGGCVVLMLGAIAVILRRRGKAFTR